MRYALPVAVILLLLLLVVAVLLNPGHQELPAQDSGAPVQPSQYYSYRVLATYPHDRFAFTEGLAYYEGMLVESTGLQGNSTIRQVNLTTGEVIKALRLQDAWFGEGATVYGDRIAQETETSGFGILYEASTLTPVGTFPYSTEGWGITFDGTSLIMSDGSSTLYFLDPATFRPVRNVTVTDHGVPVKNLNELEYIRGKSLPTSGPRMRSPSSRRRPGGLRDG